MSEWKDDSLKDLNLKTKDGKKLNFEFNPDIWTDRNGLYVLHEISVYVEGNEEKAGYLKFNFIPEENWKNVIVNNPVGLPEEAFFCIKCKGFAVNEKGTQPEILQSISPHISMSYANSQVFLKNDIDSETYQESKSDLLKNLTKKYKKMCTEYKDFHIDNPYVDFLRVEEKEQSNGIGNALYLATATFLADNGFALQSSNLKTDQAKTNFESFKKKNPELVKETKDGTFVSTNFQQTKQFCKKAKKQKSMSLSP